MKPKKTVRAVQKGGILETPSGKIAGLVFQKNGVVRATKIYVKNKRKSVL